MISLKEWNSFSSDTREAILKTVDCCSLYTFNKEYHHNFDFDAIGKRLKQIFGQCYKQPDNTIKVCVTIIPSYASKKVTPKPVVEKEEPKMKTYICCYEEEICDKNGNVIDHDSFKEWCEAANMSEARYYFENEHPNNVIIDIWEEK